MHETGYFFSIVIKVSIKERIKRANVPVDVNSKKKKIPSNFLRLTQLVLKK